MVDSILNSENVIFFLKAGISLLNFFGIFVVTLASKEIIELNFDFRSMRIHQFVEKFVNRSPIPMVEVRIDLFRPLLYIDVRL